MELKFILEAILFSAQKALNPKELRDLLAAAAEHGEEAKPFKKTRENDIVAALEQLQREHEAAERSYRLACVAGGWQFVSQPEFAPWIMALVGSKRGRRGSRSRRWKRWPSSLTASRSRGRRSSKCAGWRWTASCKRCWNGAWWSRSGGRKWWGGPMTYGTTALFLEYFGLRSLEDLPAADELRRIPVTRPEALADGRPRPGDGAAGATGAGRSGIPERRAAPPRPRKAPTEPLPPNDPNEHPRTSQSDR